MDKDMFKNLIRSKDFDKECTINLVNLVDKSDFKIEDLLHYFSDLKNNNCEDDCPTISELKEEISELKKETIDLEEEVSNLEEEVSDLEEEVSELQEKESILEKQLHEKGSKILKKEQEKNEI